MKFAWYWSIRQRRQYINLGINLCQGMGVSPASSGGEFRDAHLRGNYPPLLNFQIHPVIKISQNILYPGPVGSTTKTIAHSIQYISWSLVLFQPVEQIWEKRKEVKEKYPCSSRCWVGLDLIDYRAAPISGSSYRDSKLQPACEDPRHRLESKELK